MPITASASSPLGALIEGLGPGARPRERTPPTAEFEQVMHQALPPPSPAPARLEAPHAAALEAMEAPDSPPVPVPILKSAGFQIGTQEVPTEPELGARAIEAVSGALVAAGMDPSQFSFRYWEAWQWFPDGGYMNHNLSISTADGRTMDFSAKLVEWIPHVTVDEIQQYLLNPNVPM